MLKNKFLACATFASLLAPVASASEIDALRLEIENLKQKFEKQINSRSGSDINLAAKPATAKRNISDNSFNPSIGLILNGKYTKYSASAEEAEIAGFAVGEEGERGSEGLNIGESELNFSSNIDDKFYGSVTAAIVREEGEDKIELEEAYVQTRPELGLPDGATIKMGRAFWTFGYLNEHHAHADDFADRPLPYRVFLNKAYNDDGIEFTYTLPTDFYTEIGGGVFQGEDFPFGSSDGEGIGAWSSFIRVGGDVGSKQSWRLGAYMLSGDAPGEGRSSNEDEVAFVGDSDLHAIDLRYTFAPTGNARNKELIVQAEYFWRDEDGDYTVGMDDTPPTSAIDDETSGWYAQMIYKFQQNWRVGARYSKLDTADTPSGLEDTELDAAGHNPDAYALMVDWTNSEFSRVRLQYNNEEPNDASSDEQVILQYVVSLGAHGAHKF